MRGRGQTKRYIGKDRKRVDAYTHGVHTLTRNVKSSPSRGDRRRELLLIESYSKNGAVPPSRAPVILFAALIWIFACESLPATNVFLIKDLYPGGDGDPSGFIKSGPYIYFLATDAEAGRELWRTDLTVQGTFRLRDIRPGPESSDPRMMIDLDGVLCFVADDGEHGGELWRSDGTSEGTYMVKDIMPGEESSHIAFNDRYLIKFDGVLYFAALAPVIGLELWRSDGTEEGTYLFHEFSPGPSGTALEGKFVTDDAFYLDANNTRWKSDGITLTPNPFGTRAGGGLGLGRFWANVYGTLYLTGNPTPQQEMELWRSNGTPEGTVLIALLPPIPLAGNPEFLEQITPLEDTLYFVMYFPHPKTAVSKGGLVPGIRFLMRTDGTAEGTVRLHEADTTQNDFHDLTIVENKLYYRVFNYLYRIEGTHGEPFSIGLQWPSSFVAFNGELFFDGKYDGLAREPHYLRRTEGSPETTLNLKEFPHYDRNEHQVRNMTVSGNRLFFTVGTAAYGRELWSSDGTEAGTDIVTDIYPGPEPSNIQHLTLIDNVLIFGANDGTHGQELWAVEPVRASADSHWLNLVTSPMPLRP